MTPSIQITQQYTIMFILFLILFLCDLFYLIYFIYFNYLRVVIVAKQIYDESWPNGSRFSKIKRLKHTGDADLE